MKKQDTKITSAKNANPGRGYDFSGGVRGKHFEEYRRGHTVRIHRADGSTLVQHFTLQEGAVILEPAVRKFFPDSKSVNAALRGLIELIPKKHSATKAR